MNINHLTRWKTPFFGKEAEEAKEEGVLNIHISSRKLLELLSNVSVSFCALFPPPFQTSRLLISSRFLSPRSATYQRYVIQYLKMWFNEPLRRPVQKTGLEMTVMNTSLAAPAFERISPKKCRWWRENCLRVLDLYAQLQLVQWQLHIRCIWTECSGQNDLIMIFLQWAVLQQCIIYNLFWARWGTFFLFLLIFPLILGAAYNHLFIGLFVFYGL